MVHPEVVNCFHFSIFVVLGTVVQEETQRIHGCELLSF